ncbi:NADH-ubiquinone oxidoreductase subunit E family protein [Helicobacter pylori]|uniref:NADH-ubiquinone oxidoreductase chain E n=1 Tax=Helicobacter pylori NQ4076 TaxID=992029 RepID=I9ZAM4_HELPX|nr:NADH-ubiquinone oxidoreductase subunit E family protein [Helicobacter pylori]AHZ27271.1 NADH-ubiquinone oxidoreductase subunit E [Helicobacter pylori]AHZ30197.1 NADH-ubiquinone oxidoreductase subunit E [Helicobacter pylori]EJB33223.1 NADH-ubiquinone oxidoreductase chain E [Helicobacter pylori NQ4076]EJC17684.1 NADH-ubiquinone oxidoreductase chain E [Helicobacter pylori Hp P-74]KHL81226.1 NADH-ubiquinone oxidoreductase subunit E [Helicobacter pylori]
MKRFDLRPLKADIFKRLEELIEKEMQPNEVAIFMFEVGDFSNIPKSAEFIQSKGHELLNSLRFNQADWTIVVRKKA